MEKGVVDQTKERSKCQARHSSNKVQGKVIEEILEDKKPVGELLHSMDKAREHREDKEFAKRSH